MQGLYESGRQKLMTISDALTSFQRAQQLTDIGLLARSTLALVFGHLGEYEEALSRSGEVLQLALQAVERAKEKAKTLNGGKGDLAYVTRQRGVLGCIQFDQAKILTYVGRITEAEKRNNEALENIQRNVGSKHVSTLECWSLKARHFASTCRLLEAEEQCRKTLKVMRKEIGKEHPSTLKTLGVLVYVYRLQARLTEALNTAKYLLERCKASEAFGDNHPETIHSMWQLAEVYLARGDFSNALNLQDQVVKLGDKVLGKVHPTVVNYRACLARVYCNRGSWTSSAGLCYDVLDNYISIISDAFQDGANKVQKQEKPKPNEANEKERSKTVMQLALDRARDIFILDNNDFETLNLSIASTIQCLGVTEREREHGDLGIAEELQTKAHEFIESKLGDSHAATLSSKWDLAVTKLKRGQKCAVQDLADVTASRRRVLGEDHPDTLAARQFLSVARFNESGHINQLAEQADVLRLFIHLLGDEHPNTNAARVYLSDGYHLIRKLQDAEKLRLTALVVQIKTLPPPELTGKLKIAYEQALSTLGVDKSHHGIQEGSNLKLADKEQSDSSPKFCHAQVIASLAALALIYVDLAQSADEAMLLSVQNVFVDPESEKAHNLLISTYNSKAIAAQRVVVEQQCLIAGEYSPEALDSINTLGLIYQAAEQQKQAIDTYKLVQRLSDESSMLHFTSQSNLGTLLFNEQLYEEAEEVQAKAYEKREKFGEAVIGPKEYVIAVFNLALTKKELGKDEKAWGLMHQALKLSKDAFGATDPITGRILDTWGEWREGTGYI